MAEQQIMSDETAQRLGEALGRMAYEKGACKDGGRLAVDGVSCDCVIIEESDVYAALCRDEFNTDDESNPAYRPYSLMFDTMYATARMMHKLYGPRSGRVWK